MLFLDSGDNRVIWSIMASKPMVSRLDVNRKIDKKLHQADN